MNSPMPCASVKRQTRTMGKKLLLRFGCPFWQLVAFPPCPLESPDHSCQTGFVLIIQYNSSTCYPSLLLQGWLPWACTAGTSSQGRHGWKCLPVSEHIQHVSSYSLPCNFSMATFQLFDLWVEPMVWQSLEPPSAQGLSPAMVRQADCLGQLVPF